MEYRSNCGLAGNSTKKDARPQRNEHDFALSDLQNPGKSHSVLYLIAFLDFSVGGHVHSDHCHYSDNNDDYDFGR